MDIQILIKASFATNERAYSKGKTAFVTKEQAEEWVRIGFAEYVAPVPVKEPKAKTSKKKGDV